MEDMKKLNNQELEQVTGGRTRRVANSTVSYANVRTGPGTRYRIAYTLRNGAYVETVDRVYSEEDGYDWSQLDDGCWVASHLLK